MTEREALIEGMPWALVSRPGLPVPEGVVPSAFLSAGMVSGSTGCNRFTGSYVLEGERLEIGPLAATLMACPPLDELERTYLSALGRVASWRSDSGQLVLQDVAGAEVLRFERGTPAGRWEVAGLLRGDAVTSVLASTALIAEFGQGDALSGHAGCNRFRATYTIAGGALTISPPAATRMHCAEPEGVMEQEAAYLSLLAEARSFAIGGRTLELLSEDGARLVTFVRAETG